jgi:hypothetical protein
MEPSVPGELEFMMKPVQKHFSTSDWDFSGIQWMLDTSNYVDPPAALKISYMNLLALLKQSSVGMPLPEGMIETYFKHTASTSGQAAGWIYFRNQSADGGTGSTSFYRIQLWGSVPGENQPIDMARLQRGTSVIEVKTLNPPIYPYQWERVRVKFWVYAGVLFVSLEKYVVSGEGGAWVKLCTDWNDPQNAWANSSINRVGVCSLYTYPCLFDVTKIYRRVS